MATVFDLLDEIEIRPGMYVSADDAGRVQQLKDLEMLLRGYSLALHQHSLTGPGRDFLRAFGEHLRERFAWSMSAGAIAAIVAASSGEEEAWQAFWQLTADYRQSRLTEGQGM